MVYVMPVTEDILAGDNEEFELLFLSIEFLLQCLNEFSHELWAILLNHEANFLELLSNCKLLCLLI